MEQRWRIFWLLCGLALISSVMLQRWLAPPPKPRPQQQVAQADANRAGDEEQAGDGEHAAGPRAVDLPDEAAAQVDEAAAEQPGAQTAEAGERPPEPRRFVTFGSLDPNSQYVMLVTADSRGGSIPRIELNNPRFRDLEDSSGYLGHLELADVVDGGCRIRAVGPGTPAAIAGLLEGDVVQTFNGAAVRDADEFERLRKQFRPGDEVVLGVERQGAARDATIMLVRRPMEVVRPESDDPASYLLSLESVDGLKRAKDDEELPGVALRTGNWRVTDAGEDGVAFAYDLPKLGLSVAKRFKLAKVPDEQRDDPAVRAFHLKFDVEISSTDGKPHQNVVYRLDGPTGLPTEGAWFAYKVSSGWSSLALRDVAAAFRYPTGVSFRMVSGLKVADDEVEEIWTGRPLVFLGVDAQYFASVLIPEKPDEETMWFAESMPIRVGDVPADKKLKKTVNVSTRATSEPFVVDDQRPLRHSFEIFNGPKRPALLANYGLGDLVDYGWFSPVASVMLAILHAFYAVIPNYGVAIILLTVLVRSLMFPISRRQALNAQKMQELQPEMKRIAEKYKNDFEKRAKEQQELFKKHGYSPLSGCLPMFLQLPIFIGLYRSLAVDVELRQAPLFGESIRWCSNLAAPDMFWHWEPYLPAFIAGPTGFLGPYLNILPIVTVGLFIWQQKMFMPPPADEQAALQMKMMRWMMVFFGIMMFNVASGLCLYFIASSLWSIAERKLLPKSRPSSAGAVAAGAPLETAQPGGKPEKTGLAGLFGGNGNGETPVEAAKRRKKQRGKP